MDPRRHHRPDQTGHRRAGLLRPAHQPLGRPLRIRPMCLRHVLVLRRVRSATKAAQMARHALALREALHGLGAHPDVELLAHQLAWTSAWRHWNRDAGARHRAVEEVVTAWVRGDRRDLDYALAAL